MLSRPVTYIEWDSAPTDGAARVALYFDAARRSRRQHARSGGDLGALSGAGAGGCAWARASSPCWRRRATTCASTGDISIRRARRRGPASAIASARDARTAFDRGRQAAGFRRSGKPSEARGAHTRAGFSFDLGRVGPRPVSRYLMLAYDDLYSIEYFERRKRAWWRRNGADATDLLRSARSAITIRCWREQGFRRRADGGPAQSRAARNTRVWPRWPTARRWPRTNWWRMPTAPRCFSPRRISATAASPPWT